jgi:hypothetical protein
MTVGAMQHPIDRHRSHAPGGIIGVGIPGPPAVRQHVASAVIGIGAGAPGGEVDAGEAVGGGRVGVGISRRADKRVKRLKLVGRCAKREPKRLFRGILRRLCTRKTRSRVKFIQLDSYLIFFRFTRKYRCDVDLVNLRCQ